MVRKFFFYFNRRRTERKKYVLVCVYVLENVGDLLSVITNHHTRRSSGCSLAPFFRSRDQMLVLFTGAHPFFTVLTPSNAKAY